MPNKHAAIKDLRKNKRRALRNGRIKRHVKALFTKTKALIKEGKMDEAKEASRLFQAAADKASKRGVVHKNLAGRRKSKLMTAVK